MAMKTKTQEAKVEECKCKDLGISPVKPCWCPSEAQYCDGKCKPQIKVEECKHSWTNGIDNSCRYCGSRCQPQIKCEPETEEWTKEFEKEFRVLHGEDNGSWYDCTNLVKAFITKVREEAEQKGYERGYSEGHGDGRDDEFKRLGKLWDKELALPAQLRKAIEEIERLRDEMPRLTEKEATDYTKVEITEIIKITDNYSRRIGFNQALDKALEILKKIL